MRTFPWLGVLAVLISTVHPANAKDVALILDDKDQAMLRQVLDLATRDRGLQIAPATVYLLDKLNKAPAVTEHKEDAAPPIVSPDDKPKD